MGRFGAGDQHFRSSLTQINPNLELLNSGSLSSSSSFMLFSNGTLLDCHQQPRFPINSHDDDLREKRQNEEGTPRKRKRKKNQKEMDEEMNPRDVVHVRAKRGQATDSHSLAERVRREKINERIRCLQDLVPGCYKTMGMAVMLDVIINYVRSLQNQIEFLSMKLSAASAYCDLTLLEFESMEILQGANMYEAQAMERMLRESQSQGQGEEGVRVPNYNISSTSTSWPF